MNNKNKTILEVLPELNQIARQLKVKINSREVIKEYFKRHPEEKIKFINFIKDVEK